MDGRATLETWGLEVLRLARVGETGNGGAGRHEDQGQRLQAQGDELPAQAGRTATAGRRNSSLCPGRSGDSSRSRPEENENPDQTTCSKLQPDFLWDRLLDTNAQELTGRWRSYPKRSSATSARVPPDAAPTQKLGAPLCGAALNLEGFTTVSAACPWDKILCVFPKNLAAGSSIKFKQKDTNGNLRIIHSIP